MAVRVAGERARAAHRARGVRVAGASRRPPGVHPRQHGRCGRAGAHQRTCVVYLALARKVFTHIPAEKVLLLAATELRGDN